MRKVAERAARGKDGEDVPPLVSLPLHQVEAPANSPPTAPNQSHIRLPSVMKENLPSISPEEHYKMSDSRRHSINIIEWTHNNWEDPAMRVCVSCYLTTKTILEFLTDISPGPPIPSA